MKFAFGFCVAVSVFAITATTAPSSAQAQSLEDALAEAYRSNPSLMAERAAVRATDEDMSQAVSGFRPSLSASVAGGTKSSTNKVTGVDTDTEPQSYSLSLSQSLYSGGSTVAAIDEARNSILAARAGLASREQDILLSALTAYMDVVRDQAVLNLNASNEQVLRRQLEATRDRFEVGEITRTDVHQAEARLAGATARRIQAEGDLGTARAGYAKVVGSAPQQLTAPTPPTDLPADADDAERQAIENNPDVLEALYTARAYRDAVDGAAADLLPSLDLAGSLSRAKEATSTTSDTESLSATLTLTVPLYQTGSAYSSLRQAKQTAARYRYALDDARRGGIEAARKAWDQHTTVEAQIESIRTQIRAAETALDGVKREAGVGSRTVLDVLDAEQELLDARVSLVRAQRDQMVASYGLLAATGRLTANQLKLNVDFYDPDVHYKEVRGKFFGTSSSGDDLPPLK